jgi:hypothetical protein
MKKYFLNDPMSARRQLFEVCAGGAEDARADQTHFLERTVTGSPHPRILSMVWPTEIELNSQI